MKAISKITALSLLLTTLTIKVCLADNPIIQTIYTADPAPMVYNDTVYLYADHDEDGSTYYTMYDWRCYSSTDMVNWTDHGVMMSYRTFSWASGDAWAGQCVYRNGRFYYYVPVKSTSLGRSAIGVGVSNSPTGPFKDTLGHPLIANSGGDIDPTVYIDSDGQAYLYWGNPDLYYVKLNPDMISYSGSIVKVPLTTAGFGTRIGNASRPTLYEEGPWFYKRNGLYYLLYSAGGIPEYISYSTSSNSTGPWTYKGIIMPTQGGSFTNHCGVIDYNGNSYFFYHNGALPGGGGFTRSICIEQFTYNADSTIPTINMTTAGVNGVSNLNPYIRNEAEEIAWESGIETQMSNKAGVYVTDIDSGDYIKVKDVAFGDTSAATFTANVTSGSAGGKIELHLDNLNSTVIGTLPVSYTGGWDNWRTKTTNISGDTGVHNLYLVFKGNTKIKLFNTDYWMFGKKTTTHDLAAINASADKYKIDTASGTNTANMKVTAIYSDGTSEDVTLLATATPGQNGIVDINNGVITGIAYDTINIALGFNGKTDTVNLIVKDLKSEQTAKEIIVDTSNVALYTGSKVSFTVTAIYVDNHTEDVTNYAIYDNPFPNIASVLNGTITAISKGITTVKISFKGELGDTVKTQINISVSNRDAYKKNEAEEMSDQSGVQTENCSDAGAGMDVGFIENGDWIKINSVDFSSGATSFLARVASATSGGNIEIHLDNLSGTLVGTCAITGTGGWQTWVTKSCKVSGATGVHNLYLKFTGSSGYLFNINWWKFDSTITSLQKKINNEMHLYVVSINNNKYLKGIQPGNIVTLYNCLGQVMSTFKATSEIEAINNNLKGVLLIKVKTANQNYVLKTIM